MSPQKIFGIVALVLGVALFVIGANASDSLADQVSKTFTGRFTDQTTWYIVGGIVATVAGVVLVAGGPGRKGA